MPSEEDLVVVRHLGEAGPAGAVIARLGELCLVEADALIPGHFPSMAICPQASGSSAGLVESLAALVRHPVSRLALWTAVLLVAGDSVLVGAADSAVIERPGPRVLGSGASEILVVDRGDLDLPDGAVLADPLVTVDLDRLIVRVVVRPGASGVRLWARAHRGRERVFVASLRAEGSVLVADLLIPGGGDPLTVDVVDRLTAPPPVDGPAPARRAVVASRTAMSASARAVTSPGDNEEAWIDASLAWVDAAVAWDEQSNDGRAAIAAALAVHAAAVAGHEDLVAKARRLHSRAVGRADPASRPLAAEERAAALLGRPPLPPTIISPLVDPRLRATITVDRRPKSDAPVDLLDAGVARLDVIAAAIEGDPTQMRTLTLGWRGLAIGCELAGRSDLADEAVHRCAVLAAEI